MWPDRCIKQTKFNHSILVHHEFAQHFTNSNKQHPNPRQTEKIQPSDANVGVEDVSLDLGLIVLVAPLVPHHDHPAVAAARGWWLRRRGRGGRRRSRPWRPDEVDGALQTLWSPASVKAGVAGRMHLPRAKPPQSPPSAVGAPPSPWTSSYSAGDDQSSPRHTTILCRGAARH
jgi:hypothetical protein